MAETVDLNQDENGWFKKENILKFAPLIVISILCAVIFTPFLVAVVLAGIFALALNPYVKKLKAKVPFFNRSAHIVVYTAFLVLLILPFVVFSAKFYDYLAQPSEAGVESTISQFTNAQKVTERFINPFLKKLEIQPTRAVQTFIQKEMTDGLNYVLSALQSVITQIPQTLFILFVFMIALYYFMSDAQQIKRKFLRSHIFTYKKSQKYMTIVLNSSHSAVLTNMVVAVIQASIVGFGALFLNIGDFGLIWMITFFLSFIPLFGTAPITLFLAFLMFAKGQNAEGAGMLVVGLVSGTIDNILRSYMMANSEEANIHPIVALIGLFGAIEIMGFSGLFIGPMIMSVATKLYADHYEEKQHKANTEEEAQMRNFVHQMECLTNTQNQPKSINKYLKEEL